MAPTGAFWAPAASKLARQALQKVSKLVQGKLAQLQRAAAGANAELEPILVRNSPRQPTSRAAAVRQGRGRWYSTHTHTKTINTTSSRHFTTSPQFQNGKVARSSFPKSQTASAVGRMTTRAPFASTLRPNLTGGTLSRTSGGYSVGGGRTGGARYFSHTPTPAAQVVENVSAAVRAFWLSGQNAQFDGVTSAGEKRYRAVSDQQVKATTNIKTSTKFAPGSFIDFQVSPAITALSPLGANFPYATSLKVEAPHLNTSGFLDVLSVDFSRALKELAAVMNDLKKLSTLGDLSLELAKPSTIRVRFPGCDAEIVESLCRELCITRGTVHEDAEFDASTGAKVALMFPFASTSGPASELSSPGGSLRSQTGHELHDFEDFYSDIDVIEENPWVHSPEGYESLDDSDSGSVYFEKSSARSQSVSQDYEGLEGIYRFIEECDAARRIQA